MNGHRAEQRLAIKRAIKVFISLSGSSFLILLFLHLCSPLPPCQYMHLLCAEQPSLFLSHSLLQQLLHKTFIYSSPQKEKQL